MAESHYPTRRAAFINAISQAIWRGRSKTGQPVTRIDALMRANQVADALPQLFEGDEPSCA